MRSFHGRTVYVIQDNDAVGIKGEARIAAKLRHVAAEIKFYKWANNDPAGKDVRDLIKGAVI